MGEAADDVCIQDRIAAFESKVGVDTVIAGHSKEGTWHHRNAGLVGVMIAVQWMKKVTEIRVRHLR